MLRLLSYHFISANEMLNPKGFDYDEGNRTRRMELSHGAR